MTWRRLVALLVLILFLAFPAAGWFITPCNVLRVIGCAIFYLEVGVLSTIDGLYARDSWVSILIWPLDFFHDYVIRE